MKTIEVVAGVITDGGRFFATQRGYGDYKDGWEFPGGKVEPGESPEQALVRELKEELAVEVKVGERICTVEYDYPKFHLTMHCFFCTLFPYTTLFRSRSWSMKRPGGLTAKVWVRSTGSLPMWKS